MATIAVTAANGQLGRAIIKVLLARGGTDTIMGLARSPEKAGDIGVSIRTGDYNDRAGLELALNGVDVVLLVSGMSEPDERIAQHRNVIEAAKSAGVRKIVYTSVQGPDEGSSFSPIVNSNRLTEQDVRESGLDWVIGRNGIYIEPDMEYIENYKAAGEISNCAGNGKCGYTTRGELAYAYAQLLVNNGHNGQIYNLHGESLTQAQLADYIGQACGVSLVYRPLSLEEYRQDRVDELGDFIGTVITGIYSGIRTGAFDNASDFAKAAGRPHISWSDYFSGIKATAAD